MKTAGFWCPSFRSHREFSHNFVDCSRTQVPLFTAFAISVHKSQGSTQGKIVLNISDKEFSPGSNYVALSRVKTMEGVLFDSPFGLDTLRRPQGATADARLTDWTRRKGQILQPLDHQMLDQHSSLGSA